MDCHHLIEKLTATQKLSKEEYLCILENASDDTIQHAAKKAHEVRNLHYGNKVFIRGLIEISNICKNNCLYCGIRCGNKNAIRYRMTESEILNACRHGHELGFRTFVLQGGEDPFFTDEILCGIIGSIKREFPECAVTLSLGERTAESYMTLKNAGADRYLLRHETATKNHYEKLHPQEMSFENRIECLANLRKCGFAVGAGFMVGSPYQTKENLAEDLLFIQNLKPQMCGIGPFIPHKDTEFKNEKSGSAEETILCLSLIRLSCPKILLPATTALATIYPDGIERAMKSGANVIMPNLTPSDAREKYSLYDNKSSSGTQCADNVELLRKQMMKEGFEVTVSRGDPIM